MNPGAIHHLVGKFTVRASFGTITYGPRKGAKKGTSIARVLVLPDGLIGDELADWLEQEASAHREASNSGISGSNPSNKGIDGVNYTNASEGDRK